VIYWASESPHNAAAVPDRPLFISKGVNKGSLVTAWLRMSEDLRSWEVIAQGLSHPYTITASAGVPFPSSRVETKCELELFMDAAALHPLPLPTFLKAPPPIKELFTRHPLASCALVQDAGGLLSRWGEGRGSRGAKTLPPASGNLSAQCAPLWNRVESKCEV
jgi:hypothetical protein